MVVEQADLVVLAERLMGAVDPEVQATIRVEVELATMRRVSTGGYSRVLVMGAKIIFTN